jgi:tetratricopeptide (TPR) repeat protein
MKKYFLLYAILFISTSCLAELESISALANTAEEKGEIDKAIELYQKDIELNGEQASSSMHRLGNIYRRAGEYDLGLKYYDMFLEIMPDANNVNAKREICYKMVNINESFSNLKKSNRSQYLTD